MERTNLTQADYGLIEGARGFFTAVAINHVIDEAKGNRWMTKDEKLFYIYQVLKRYKDANALNEKAMDAIEAQIAM